MQVFIMACPIGYEGYVATTIEINVALKISNKRKYDCIYLSNLKSANSAECLFRNLSLSCSFLGS